MSTGNQSEAALTLVDSLERAAREHPDHVAFRCLDQSLDYASLDNAANKLAHRLISIGVNPGDRVALVLPRSLESVVALYGVLKSGGCYVPLDAATPAEQLALVLLQCDVRAALFLPASSALAEAVSEAVMMASADNYNVEAMNVVGSDLTDKGFGRSICVLDDWSDDINEPQSALVNAPPVSISPDDPAYIIHTSGTTGRPKGIVHTHASAIEYVRLSIAACDLRQTDVIGSHAPLHTDMSTLGVLVSPWLASTSVIVSEAHARMPASLVSLIASSGVTVWYSVPLALVQMLDSKVLPRHDLSALRWVIYAGEAFAPSRLKSLLAQLPGIRVSNQYGPAETNVCTVFNLGNEEIDAGLLDSDQSVPIGWPQGDNVARLVDDADNEVVDGDAGELLIASATMMRGYWERPDLDAAAFVDTSDGLRFYRTGDLARMTKHGLSLLGRRDRQVKVRGFRVELDDVERRLAACPGVLEVATFVERVEPIGTLCIHAAILCEGDDRITQRAADYASRHLSPAAVPETFHTVTDFPRTTSGKVDRLTLERELTGT